MSDANIELNNFQPARKTGKRKNTIGVYSMEAYNGIEGRFACGAKRRRTDDVHNVRMIFNVLVEHLGLQVKFNMDTRNVQIRACKETKDTGHLQRAADFVKAFVYGFDVEDALALLRLNDLFVETFEIKDVKTLTGHHLTRAIGRIAGKGGKTKFILENATKTRIVLVNSKIHILGSYQNIRLARRFICDLILGAPQSKMYGRLRIIAGGVSERL